jgi:hypothetical protein
VELFLPEPGCSVFEKITCARNGGMSEIEMFMWMEVTASSCKEKA